MAETEERRPAAWLRALERFRGAYGCEPDLTDDQDVFLFYPLLEDEVESGFVEAIKKATERLRAFDPFPAAEEKEFQEWRRRKDEDAPHRAGGAA